MPVVAASGSVSLGSRVLARLLSSTAIAYESGLPGLSAYFATKHALSGFSACLFEDVKHLDIKVQSWHVWRSCTHPVAL